MIKHVYIYTSHKYPDIPRYLVVIKPARSAGTPAANLYGVVLRGGRPHAQRVRWPHTQRVWFIVYIKIKGDFLPSVGPPAGGS